MSDKKLEQRINITFCVKTGESTCFQCYKCCCKEGVNMKECWLCFRVSFLYRMRCKRVALHDSGSICMFGEPRIPSGGGGGVRGCTYCSLRLDSCTRQ
jgi:hypothetical protein